MDELSIKTAKLVGTPNQHSWSQVHSFIPEEKEKKEKRGHLLAILSFSGEEGIEAVTTGREILARLHEEYYGETETKAFERLAQAVNKVDEEFTQPGRSLEIIAGAIIGKIAYLVVKGEGRILLKRNSAFQTLIKGQKEKLETASGFVKEGDLLFLGSGLLFQVLPEGRLRAALGSEMPGEVVEAIAPTVLGQKKMARAACLVGLVEGRGEPQEEVEEVEEVEAKTAKPKPAIQPVPSLKENLKSRLSQLSSRFPQRIGRVYVRHKEREAKQKKTILAIAVILIVLLGISFFFGSKKREASQRKQKFDQLYVQIEEAIREGEALKELNPIKAKETLFQAENLLTELEELEVEETRLEEIKTRLEQVISQVVREHELAEVPVFFDLSLVRDQGRGEEMALYRTKGVILDPQEERLFGFDLTRKSIEVLAGGDDLKGASLATIYDDRAYVLTEEGIVEVQTENKRTNLVIEKDEDWGEILAIGAYGGNLYLVDKSGMIWRYPATETGFGTKQEWFGSGVSSDLSEIVSMAIDGSIWLLDKDGRLFKYTRGAPDAFGFSGLDKDLVSPRALYADDETENLYLLDRGNSRILVVAKSGEYQDQYLWPTISQATDLVANEAEKKLLLLVNDKVYEIGLE